MSTVTKRDSAKRSLKRQLEASNKANADYDVQELETFIELLKESWVKYSQAQDAVEESCGAETIDLETAERQQGEEFYAKAMVNFKRALAAKRTTQQDMSNAEHVVVPKIKLPHFDLPKFDGDHTKWLTFYDSFKTIIHNNDALSGSQKLHYLRCCLANDALKLINNFKLHDANYVEAWRLLHNRYNIKRVLKDHHLQAIFDVKRANEDTASGIKAVLDPILQQIRALKALFIPVEYWDDILVHILVHKLAPSTRHQWELSIKEDKSPTFEELQEFLEVRCRSLEVIACNPDGAISFKSTKNVGKKASSFHCSSRNDTKCFYCNGDHKIYQCQNFRALSPEARYESVRSKGACFNCLSVLHRMASCKSTSQCKTCKGAHNTLIHRNEETGSSSAQQTLEQPTSSVVPPANAYTAAIGHSVLLATACIKTFDRDGNPQFLRALLDTGSNSTFLSEGCAQRLQLKKTQKRVTVRGIGCSNGTSKGEVSLSIKSTDDVFSAQLTALIMPKLTGIQPPTLIANNEWSHITGLKLADPCFNKPGRIDLLIGADELPNIIESEIVKGPPGTPIAQRTVFGWVLFGKVQSQNENNTMCMHADVELSKLVAKAWELEELPKIQHLTPEEKEAERIFDATHSRNTDGRFVVNLPFKQDQHLGESRNNAVRSWLRMERRLTGNAEHYKAYQAFLQEMIDQGHMVPATNMPRQHFYMPHHSVVKDSSETTKIRVVFNASQKTSNGRSLNDNLLVGPQLQQDLFTILNRFQTHRFALIADVAAMYRQIMITEDDADYQRVIWRKAPQDALQDFKIVRVTYGVASSAHHAVKALQKTALDNEKTFPAAASVVLSDFYMDDLLTGSATERGLHKLRKEIVSVLHTGCFELRKWASNSSHVLNNIPSHSLQSNTTHLLAKDDSVRALGLMWNSKEDVLYFNVDLGEEPVSLSKRSVLSDSCRLFDPTGKIAPVTLVPKLLVQRLWQLGIDWDDAIPADIASYWLSHRNDLKALGTLRVPRWIGTGMEGSTTELHCFADASERAYAGVVYARTIHPGDTITVAMVSAKTKVSPLKSISIAKLELCAAALVSKLAAQISTSFGALVSGIFGWTDSMNALAWLRSHPSRWSVFVANRVAKAQEIIPPHNWQHIASEQNPADCASRGLSPSQLLTHRLWFDGPEWLSQPSQSWPTPRNILPTEQEMRQFKPLVLAVNAAPLWDLHERYSSFIRLKRITAYCMRFISRLRHGSVVQTGFLTSSELANAEEFWLKEVQASFFAEDIHRCRNGKPISFSSPVARLNAFLDEKGILRVGGRIRHSSVADSIKFPVILPAKSPVVTIMVNDLHIMLQHGGPQLMQATLQRRFWVVGARNLIRKIYRSCLTCRRFSVSRQQQMMADLPAHRVTSCRPFLSTGLDMAGPFHLKLSKGRGVKTTKGYVAVFICMSTGAMHLELASDLSSETFIAVLKRFVSRRGHCRTYFTDNGTNFVGAYRDLKQVYQQALADENLQRYLADSHIEWRFNPPRAPHMGGYWESAVKRVKFHLKRALDTSTLLTYEEFYTVLTEVEACVNSRPLCPLSSDCGGLEVLTPGHFLISEPLVTLPESEPLQFNGSLNQRWVLLSQIRNHFWRRWHADYLTTLQRRSKWLRPKENIKVDDLVVLKEPHTPPSKWRIARVIDCYPGPDNQVRVVQLKTADGILKRATINVVPLLTS